MMAMVSTPAMGATSISELPPCNSPRAETVMVTSSALDTRGGNLGTGGGSGGDSFGSVQRTPTGHSGGGNRD